MTRVIRNCVYKVGKKSKMTGCSRETITKDKVWMDTKKFNKKVVKVLEKKNQEKNDMCDQAG